MKSNSILEIKNLSVRRGRVKILRRLSWSVARGEHWVIVGANGCGKTSLLAALTGYLCPTEGDISLLGEPFGESDWRELRKRIGVVSSSIRQLMADAEPAVETVATGKYAMIDAWGQITRADIKKAAGILKEMGSHKLADRPWGALSQGERQRILIGRALMAEPDFLILDEPCAGLDPVAREHFLQFVEALGNREDAPALALVTHHLEEITPAFTHAMVMESGQIVAAGPIKKVLTAKILSKAFGSEVKVRRPKTRWALEVVGRARGSVM